MEPALMHPLIPGERLPGDWHDGKIPDNIVAGPNTMIDSSACFRGYSATGAVGLRTGANVTLWRLAFAIGTNGMIEIGDSSCLTACVLTCADHLTIGCRVYIAPGVTITDSDFHPLGPAGRILDTIAISLVGDRSKRPAFGTAPVVVEDDVWIGYNATILKGVRIGAGAIVHPGAVVTRDVAPGMSVAGNPAIRVEEAG